MPKSQTMLSFVHNNVSWTTRLTLKWLITVPKFLLPLSVRTVYYLGVLLDSNLSWKFHINNVTLKVSRTVGVVARLRHFAPRTTLLNIYQSLILPYLTVCKNPFTKHSRATKTSPSFEFFFSEPKAHAVPLFISSNFLPSQMLYAEKVSSIMFHVSCLNASSKNCDLVIKANSKHKHETRFSSSEIIMSKLQEWVKIKVLFPVLQLNFGAQFPTNFANSPKELLKNIFTTYCSR